MCSDFSAGADKEAFFRVDFSCQDRDLCIGAVKFEESVNQVAESDRRSPIDWVDCLLVLFWWWGLLVCLFGI